MKECMHRSCKEQVGEDVISHCGGWCFGVPLMCSLLLREEKSWKTMSEEDKAIMKAE